MHSAERDDITPYVYIQKRDDITPYVYIQKLIIVTHPLAGDFKRCSSYQQACEFRGLLATDEEWKAALTDCANETVNSASIRELLTTIICHNSPADAMSLFEGAYTYMCDDYERTYATDDDDTLRLLVLHDIEGRMNALGVNLRDRNMVFDDAERAKIMTVLSTRVNVQVSKTMRDEMRFDKKDMRTLRDSTFARAKPAQLAVLTRVTDCIDNDEGCFIFVDAPGGTGKTYTFNGLLAHTRSTGRIALAVASSGIAALLLMLGRTVHSRFKASLTPTEGYLFNIPVQVDLAKLVVKASLIVWDESPMMHRQHLEALDLTLRDLMSILVDPKYKDIPFGGKVGGRPDHTC